MNPKERLIKFKDKEDKKMLNAVLQYHLNLKEAEIKFKEDTLSNEIKKKEVRN